MAKGKHISLEDISNIFQKENNISAADEEMLIVLQHLAACRECLDKIKAHRRLELLLENWTPELHGQAFCKMEALKETEESRKSGKVVEESAAGSSKMEQEADDEDDYEQDDDGEHTYVNETGEACDDDCDCDCDCGCEHDHDCGHDHGSGHNSRHGNSCGHNHDHDHNYYRN